MRAIAIAASVLALALTSPARADDAAAKVLFDEGKTLFAEGKYGEACTKLEASFKLAATSSARGLLGACYEKIGRLASAWAAYRDSAAIAERQNNAERAQLAREKATELEPKLARLHIDASAVAGEPKIDVTIDGVVQPRAALGEPLPIDAGPHVIAADGVGWKKWETTVDIADGERQKTTVPRLVEDPSELAANESPAAAGRTRRQLVALGITGGGAAAVGVAIALGAVAKIDWSNSKCTSDGTCPTDMQRQQGQSAARTADIATVVGAAGLVVVGAGVVLYLTAPKRERAPRVVPVATPNAVGAAVVGRF